MTLSQQPRVIDTRVVRLNHEQRTLTVLIDKKERVFHILPTAMITKDGERVTLAALAAGDVATLHLVTGGSDRVDRIQAVSARPMSSMKRSA